MGSSNGGVPRAQPGSSSSSSTEALVDIVTPTTSSWANPCLVICWLHILRGRGIFFHHRTTKQLPRRLPVALHGCVVCPLSGFPHCSPSGPCSLCSTVDYPTARRPLGAAAALSCCPRHHCLRLPLPLCSGQYPASLMLDHDTASIHIQCSFPPRHEQQIPVHLPTPFTQRLSSLGATQHA